jgi:hypothetical protein
MARMNERTKKTGTIAQNQRKSSGPRIKFIITFWRLNPNLIINSIHKGVRAHPFYRSPDVMGTWKNNPKTCTLILFLRVCAIVYLHACYACALSADISRTTAVIKRNMCSHDFAFCTHIIGAPSRQLRPNGMV